MKENIKKIFHNPMLIVFILILIFFTPLSIYSPGENRNRGIVTAIGIDKNNQEIEISLLTFIPTANQTYKVKSSIISGKGTTVAEAVYDAQLQMGRKIGLAHAKTTIVNEELLSEDVSMYVDYLSRVASLPENTVFISTNNTAKELLETSQSLENELGLKLEQLVGFNANNIYVTDTSLEAFYKGYFSEVKSSIIGSISLEESDKGSNQEETNVDDSKENSSSNKKISNKGEAVLLKDGKMVAKLNIDQLNGINLLNTRALNQIITIDNVKLNDDLYTLNYRIKNKNIFSNANFENDIPIYTIQLKLGMELVEINGLHDAIKMNTEFSEISEEIQNKLDIEIKKQFTNALNVLKENKTDVLGINEKFFRENRIMYLKYIENLENIDDFLDKVNFKLNVIIQPD